MGDCFLEDLCECLHLKLNSGKSAQSNLDVGQDKMNALRLECHCHRRLPVWKIQTL